MLKITKLEKKFGDSPGMKTRIYVWAGDENVLENLANRFSRPYKMYKQHAIPAILKEMGLDPNTTKVRWSQKAGCSCGCSPAFIVDGHFGKDVFVTVDAVDSDTNILVAEDQKEISANRRAQLGMDEVPAENSNEMALAILRGTV